MSNEAQPVGAILRKRLRSERLAREISQDALAEDLGVHVNTLRRREGGQGGTTLDSYVIWCETLGLEPAQEFNDAYDKSLGLTDAEEPTRPRSAPND